MTVKELPEPNHEYGYTHSRLKEFFGEAVYKKFCTWMNGQTQMYDDELKQPVAYAHDVERFLEAEQKGKRAHIYD